MNYRLEFTLSTIPLTFNQLISKGWRARFGNFSKIKKEIHLLTLKTKPKKPLNKARVKLVRYSPGTLDRDNSFATFKPILDGLVECGVLVDDGFEMVNRIEIIQVKCKQAERKIEVIVEEVL